MPTEKPDFRSPAYPRGWHGSETTEEDREWYKNLKDRGLLVGRGGRADVQDAHVRVGARVGGEQELQRRRWCSALAEVWAGVLRRPVIALDDPPPPAQARSKGG